MIVTAITLTYGRVAHLNECIAGFLAQDYEDKRMIVLNSCPQQTLVGEFPNVRIINLATRPPSLAACRNLAISEAKPGVICTLDDDDNALPNHLSTIAKHFGPEDYWIWLDAAFYLENWQIKSVVRTLRNTFAFTRVAWETIGYNNALSVGEDRVFVARMTSELPGKRVTLQDDEATYLYCWANRIEHISGLGDDRPGVKPAWERARLKLAQKIRSGVVKTGRIELQPCATRDYAQMVKDFLVASTGNRVEGNASRLDVGVVLLGRTGDIVNFLPVLRHIAETYAKPHLVVSREFAQLLEGVSYVEAFPVDLSNDRLLPAIKLAKEKFAHVIVAQPWSQDYKHMTPKLESYNLQSWSDAGFAHKFYDKSWMPVFDRRNLAREEALWTKLDTGKPVILVKLDGSISSPCPECKNLWVNLSMCFARDYTLLDLSHVRAERVYDLLGLMSRAEALISIDSMPLHLAAAASIPTVALVNPQPWLGTLPRCRCVRRLTYTEALAKPQAVIDAVGEALKVKNLEITAVQHHQPPHRKIWHAYEVHGGDADARKRKARMSWTALYQHGVVPWPLMKYPRDATSIGDKRQLPFLKDVLSSAMNEAGPDDIILFTNDDIALHPELPERALFHASVYGPFSSQRCEFKRHMPPMSKPPAIFALNGEHHLGRDLFAFPKRWLLDHWNEIPDFILGAPAWDLCVAAMIRLEYGIQTTRQNIGQNFLPSELDRGYVAHEFHKAHWTSRQDDPSRTWNNQLFKAWAGLHLPTLRFNPKNEI